MLSSARPRNLASMASTTSKASTACSSVWRLLGMCPPLATPTSSSLDGPRGVAGRLSPPKAKASSSCPLTLAFTSAPGAQRVYGGTLERAIRPLHLLPAADLRDRMTFDSCAVVSNSGKLQGRRLGGAIDAHDAVFRINEAATAVGNRSFARDVGEKTTVRVLNDLVLHDRQARNAPYLAPGVPLNESTDGVATERQTVVFSSPTQLSFDLSSWGRAKAKWFRPLKPAEMYSRWQQRHPRSPAYMLSAAFNIHLDKLLHDFVGGREELLVRKYNNNATVHGSRYIYEPSTGFVSVMLAVQLCREVDVHPMHAYTCASPSCVWHAHGMCIQVQLCREVDVFEIFPSSQPAPAGASDSHYWSASVKPNAGGATSCPHSCMAERLFLQRHSTLSDWQARVGGHVRLSRYTHPWLEMATSAPDKLCAGGRHA